MKKIKGEGIQETIYKEVLANGLTVYYYPNKNFQGFFLNLGTNFGGDDLRFKYEGEKEFHEVPLGLAHFLEHITFSLEDMDAHELFKKYGSRINAATSAFFTRYIVYGDNNINECIDNLLYYVYTPYYTDETVENERNIIREEYKRNKDQVDRQFFLKQMELLFSEYKYNEPIVGNIEDINSITLEHINYAYDYFYHPSNMALVISGNFDIKEVQKVINKRMGMFNFSEHKKVIVDIPKEPVKVNKEFLKIEENTSVNKVAYLIKTPLKAFDKLKLSKKELLVYLDLILKSNLGSTSLYASEIEDNGISSTCSSIGAYTMQDYLIISITNTPYDVDKFIDITKKYINDLTIDEEDIKRKIKMNSSDYILSFDDMKNTTYDIFNDFNEFGDYEIDYIKILKSFDKKIGDNIIRIIDFDNKSILVFTPKEK